MHGYHKDMNFCCDINTLITACYQICIYRSAIEQVWRHLTTNLCYLLCPYTNDLSTSLLVRQFTAVSITAKSPSVRSI